MSTPYSPALDFGSGLHLCFFENCPGGSEAEAWHEQQAVGLIHALKQDRTEAPKDHTRSIAHAQQLGAHRPYVASRLHPQMDAAVAFIPDEILNNPREEQTTSYEGT